MCLGKGIKGTNVQSQSLRRLSGHTCRPFPLGPTQSRRDPSPLYLHRGLSLLGRARAVVSAEHLPGPGVHLWNLPSPPQQH